MGTGVSKNGNGEGSIYPHERNGKGVGYRGAYVAYTAAGTKRRYITGKDRDEVRQKLTKAMGIGTTGSSSTPAR